MLVILSTVSLSKEAYSPSPSKKSTVTLKALAIFKVISIDELEQLKKEAFNDGK
jgi:hypothetical protein